MNSERINPILFGLIAGVITYIIIYVDVKYENKKLKMKSISNNSKCSCPIFYVTLKVPLIIGALVWASISYLDNNKFDSINDDFMNNSTSLFDQDIFSDMPNF